jgi:2'-5' RNA ligase
MESSKKRLFIAIGLPANIVVGLSDLQKQLKRFARDAKWVRPEGIHLTLKFLAYVEEENIPAIQESMDGIARSFHQPSIRVKGCGFFPNHRRPRILWTGIECAELQELQEAIEQSLTPLGFEKENRPFSPHLTLARFREPGGLLPLVHESEKYKDAIVGEFTADCFSLYQSILHREGAEYRILRSFALTKK